jgi:hypothetical protein
MQRLFPYLAAMVLVGMSAVAAVAHAFLAQARSQRQMIGEPPEWALWVMVGLLAFVMLLPTIKR